MDYRVIGLDNTAKFEKDFNTEYHQKYIGQVGIFVDHPYKTGVFKDFFCLYFSKDDIDWFHRNDLTLDIESLHGGRTKVLSDML